MMEKSELDRILMQCYLLTDFEVQKYQQNEPRFKGVYSQNKLPKKLTKTIKDGSYVVNLHEYISKETHGIALCINGDSVTYFDRFGFEHIPEEIKRFICNRNIIKITSEYRPMTK